MPIWEWLLESAAVVLVIVLLLGVALVVRRRWLSRYGGTFELSYRARASAPGRGWLLGLGRYTGDRLEWFRIFSLSPRPKMVWQRSTLNYVERRDPGWHGRAGPGFVVADGVHLMARVRPTGRRTPVTAAS